MLCMRKAHLLWGYRYCLVLTTSAETNPDKIAPYCAWITALFTLSWESGERRGWSSAEWERHPQCALQELWASATWLMCPCRTQVQQGQLRPKLWLKWWLFQCLPNFGSAWKYLNSALTCFVSLCASPEQSCSLYSPFQTAKKLCCPWYLQWLCLLPPHTRFLYNVLVVREGREGVTPKSCSQDLV